MSVHLERQIDKLKKSILGLGTRVEEAVADAITAFAERDADLAERVAGNDTEIDLIEVDIEEECLKTFALHQPVAFDLRYVVAVLKINNDLERIGDLAVNLSEQAGFLAIEPPLEKAPLDVRRMGGLVQTMLRQSLDSLINVDSKLAQRVRDMDNEVDMMHRQMYESVQGYFHEDANRIQTALHYLTASRQLERMADHTVNIAEDVLYLARGEIHRHESIRQGLERASF